MKEVTVCDRQQDVDRVYTLQEVDGVKQLDLLNSFRETYPDLDQVQTVKQVMVMVNLSDEIRDWYLDFKKFRSVFVEKPEWLPDDKGAINDWAKLQSKMLDQKSKIAAWERRITDKSKQLKDEIAVVESEKRNYFKNLDPMLVINSLTVNHLSKSDVLELALEGDEDKRNELMKNKVRKHKEMLYVKFKETNVFDNPYAK
jgi:hypothetical protein